MAETGRRDLTNANEVEHWSIPVLGKTRSSSGLKESRLIVIEDSDEALEILIRPAAPGIEGPGYLQFLNAIVVILVFALIWPWSLNPSHMAGAGWLGVVFFLTLVFFIGGLTFSMVYPQYLAGLWTRLRLADGTATIRHPNWRGKEQVTEFRLTDVAKYPKERYSAVHHVQLSGCEKPFVCWPPLPYEQVLWLIEKIQPRIQVNDPRAQGNPADENQIDLARK